jgi:hypothetical protein
MQTDSERFNAWLHETDYVSPNAKKRKAAKVPLYLNRELALPQGIADGISVGGKQAHNWRGKIGHRLSDRSITSDVVVTTAQGDTYTIRRRRSTTPTVRVAGRDYAADYATLQRIAGTIGNVE